MRIKLLARALWQHHRRASIIAIVAVLALLAAPFAMCASSSCPSSVETADSEDAQLVLDRVWFSAYPEEARTEISIWLWITDGIGVYQQGSAYRASFDIFEFVRSGRELTMTSFQDSHEAQVRFAVESCDDLPPFDLCLTLDGAARGPARYYGFSDQDALEDMPAHMRQLDAEARATARR